MLLEKYNKKRNFKVTPEPPGKVAKGKGHRFFIQKHDASHLHFDFRLEHDGVLKSWAIPKGPSTSPQVRRLAMEVEDHPLDYGDFEGTIPEGEYGGGTVMLWDRGTWEPEENATGAFKKGKITFTLKGERLTGKWTLVRSPKAQSGKNMWFIIKNKDATKAKKRDPVAYELTSVVSGRSMDEIADKSKKVWHSHKAARKEKVREESKVTTKGKISLKLSAHFKPELATLVDEAPQGNEWIHEVKFDGYRITAVVKNNQVKLFSRNGLDWTHRLRQIAESLGQLQIKDALLDGEVIVAGAQGHSDFQALQLAFKEDSQALFKYYLFDILSYNGKDLLRTPLLERKELLKKVIKDSPLRRSPLLFSDYVVGGGEKLFNHACRLGLEGIVSKKSSSRYESGRSSDWLKVKCIQRQEFAVVGYSAPQGARSGFGALLLALPDKKGVLRYVGRAGTGFNATLIKEVKARLDKFKVRDYGELYDPSGELEKQREVTWVKPKVVVELKFATWTRDRHLRQAVFLGVREDKKVTDLTFEEKKPAAEVIKTTKPSSAKAESQVFSGIKISKPAKVLFTPDITKGDLASYYQTYAKQLLPYFENRPIAVVRCPDGHEGTCFFQKHEPSHSIGAKFDPKLIKKGPKGEYIYVDSLPGILSLVQLGVLEFHGWEAPADRAEKPDQVVFDLDQDVKVSWEVVQETALRLRDRLRQLKLVSFCKTTGGKGLHIVVPFKPEKNWDDVKAFSKLIADTLATEFPELYTSNMAKAKRDKKIFIDYLRNGRGATAVLPYSTRAKAGAPVSTPITWEELPRIHSADQFTLKNIGARLKKLKKDPWADFFKVQKKQRLPNLGSL